MGVNLLDRQLVHGLYIPSMLLLVGITIVRPQWLPHAAAFIAVVGAVKVYQAAPKQVLNPVKFQQFELKEKTILSHNTAIYRFALPRTIDYLGLPIGQHISVGASINGQQVVRSYTPISSDHNKGYFDLLIKAYPTGNISKYMSKVQIGQTIDMRGPKGAMVYTPNMVKKFGMIAGGTGITPMLQIIRAVIRGRSNGDITEIDLIFANVNEHDILLREDLDDLVKQDPKFRVHYVLNNPPQNWSGGVGFVTADMIKEKIPAPSSDMKLLICGPPAMVSAMKKAVQTLGFEKPRPVSKLADQVFCF